MSNTIKGFNTKNGVVQYDYNALANRPEDGTGTIISPNADYAEVGEWEDGNPASEDRLGYFVAIAAVEDNTIKIRKATSQDDVKGVTVFNPAFSGNASAEKYVSAGVLYPQYSYVGLMGIVSVIDNGTCIVGGRCMPADDGTAVPSSNNMGYGVLKRIDASRVLIAVEPGADMVQRIKRDIEGIGGKLDDDVESNRKTTAAVSSLAAQTEKRVTNLEAAVYGDLAQENEDNSLAYVKDVPQNALPFAEVKAIGGMTRKCTNLIPDNIEGGALGINGGKLVSYTSGGTCHIKGIPLKAGTYTASGVDTIYFYVYDKNGVVDLTKTAAQGTLSPYTFTVDTDCYCGVTGSRESLVKHMLNTGTTALPYEPYFEGLRSAKAERVASVGRNIFGGAAMANKLKEVNPNTTINTEKKTVSYYAGGISDKVVFTDFKPNTQYTIIFKGLGSSGFLNLIVRYTDGTNGDFDKIPTTDAGVARFVSAPSKSIKGLYGIWFDGSTTLFYDECGIFEGDVQAADFTPYVKHTLPIPAEVRAKPWYGLGISKDVCNAIRYNEDGSRSGDVKCAEAVLDGSADEDIQMALKGEAFTLFYCTFFGGISYSEAVSNYLDYRIAWDADNAHFYVSADAIIFVLPNSIATDVATARAYLASNPLEIVYELATPTTEDISDILPADNYIEVEGGGTLTFKNEYGYDVPSEVTFVTKGASA